VSAIEQREAERQNTERHGHDGDGLAVKARHDLFDLRAGAFGLRAAGVGGGINGMGADVILLDDISASEESVATQAGRDKLWRFYQSKLYTRRNPGCSIVVVMSRWHDEDLVGKLLTAEAEGGEKWRVIRLPAIAEEEDPLGREVGEALWPEKYDLEELDVIRSTVGVVTWAAQYMQNPRPSSGFILDSSKLVRIEPWEVNRPGMRLASADQVKHKIVKWVRYWDLAFSERQGADFLAGVLCGIDAKRNFYIVDVKQMKGRWPINKPKIIDVALEDGHEVTQIIECNGTQLGYAQDIKDDPRMRGIHVQGFSPDKHGNKEARASVWGSRLEDGIIFALRLPWLAALCAQMDSFGAKGAHDDQVDGVSGSWAALHTSPGGGLHSI